MDSTKLRHHAQRYFQKKLFLNPSVSGDDINVVVEGVDEPTDEPILEKAAPKVNRKTLIDRAEDILSNFPIEKSMFSPERKHLPTQSIFEKRQDPDKLINSLLFSTKLVFFDSSKTSSDIINEVSGDSFGYINILRNNQISIMEKELARIEKEKDFLESSEISTRLKRVRDRRDAEISQRNKYLEGVISFYAEYVMGVDNQENKKKVMGWLDKKVEQNKR